VLAFPVREVRSLEPSVEVAPHACLELRVDQSCRYGGDRENRITVSCMGGMKRTGLGTQRGRKLRKYELKPSVREGSSAFESRCDRSRRRSNGIPGRSYA